MNGQIGRRVTHGALAIGAALAAMPVSAQAAAAQFADSVVAERMGGTVWMLRGAGDVIAASVGPDGVLLVDNGFMRTVDSVRAALRRLGGGAPRFVINTHWHHSDANDAFAADATIIAHERTRVHLRDGASMYGQSAPARAARALPDIVFADSMSLFFNGERIDLVHLPGAHTDSDIAVVFTGSRVAVLGDVFVPFIPVTDYASGGDLYASRDAIAMLLRRLPADVRIVPGHGRGSTVEDLRGFHEMLTGMIAYVEREVAAGRSVDDLVAAGVPAAWQSWRGELLSDEFVLRNFHEGVVRGARRGPAANSSSPQRSASNARSPDASASSQFSS